MALRQRTFSRIFSPSYALHPERRLTLIGSASSSGQTEIVEFLLAQGAEVDAPQTGGVTALHSAAHNGNQPLVILLLSKGADPKLRTDDGRNAVDMARDNGHDAVVQLLESALQE